MTLIRDPSEVLVPRPGLVGRLAEAIERGGVLVVAAAGYGKTSALRETLAARPGPTAWISCAAAGGDAGLLLLALVERLRDVAPGSADVLAERLAATLHRVDIPTLARTLRGELEQLVVEPVVVVLDDAEELERSPEAIELVDILLHAAPRALRLVVASRRPLPLRTAKLLAAGELTELGTRDLAFTAEECAAVLERRSGRAPAGAEVDRVMAGTEGWPLGVALSEAAPGHAGTSPQAGREAVFAFLDEEVLSALDPQLREDVLDASVTLDVTEPVLDALGLPATFPAQVQRAGLVLRAAGGQEPCWAFHPLVREFLRGRLVRERSPAGLQALHARVADALSGTGREREAVEHWLDAGDWRAAIDGAVRLGPALQRVSPATVRGWLDRLPAAAWAEPAPQLVLGRLEWGAGRHGQATVPLRAAVAGFDDRGDAASAWLARWVLCDALMSTGGFDEIEALAAGWDDPALAELGPLPLGVAWYLAFALLSRGRFERADALLARLRADPVLAPSMRHFDRMFSAYQEISSGHVERALELLAGTVDELRADDAGNRASYALATLALMQADCGRRAEALHTWERVAAVAEAGGLSFTINGARWARAFLLAQEAGLGPAEAELRLGGRPAGGGWHDAGFHKARAAIALLRGEPAAAVAAAERALDLARPAALNIRIYTSSEMAPVLVEAGAPQLARATVDETLAALDAAFPEASGRYPRARLLAVRAWMRSRAGDVAGGDADLERAWAQAHGCEHHLLRVEWPRLEPLLGPVLERGTLDPASVVGALQRAFPGGAALVGFIDHPLPAMRHAALPAAVASGHPGALARLPALARDPHPGIAAAAAAAQASLRRSPPPLTFRLLGSFAVRRATWELDAASWGRPLVARLVRFLLVHRAGATPESRLFEAFWPDMAPDAARRNLAVALSLARKALDVPGAQDSVIQSEGRAHQLRLLPVDRVDAEDFEAAAAAALGAAGAQVEPLLERAEALWSGLPLPEELFADWSVAWRERLTDRYTHVLAALTRTYADAGRTEDALRLAGKLVELDPLNEAAQRALIASYARAGRRNHALRQFLACRRVLVDELGVEPSAATARLHERVLAGTPV